MPAVLIKVHSSIWTLTTSRKLKANGSTRLNCEMFFHYTKWYRCILLLNI
jgi:hypothetical protein